MTDEARRGGGWMAWIASPRVRVAGLEVGDCNDDEHDQGLFHKNIHPRMIATIRAAADCHRWFGRGQLAACSN